MGCVRPNDRILVRQAEIKPNLYHNFRRQFRRTESSHRDAIINFATWWNWGSADGTRYNIQHSGRITVNQTSLPAQFVVCFLVIRDYQHRPWEYVERGRASRIFYRDRDLEGWSTTSFIEDEWLRYFCGFNRRYPRSVRDFEFPFGRIGLARGSICSNPRSIEGAVENINSTQTNQSGNESYPVQPLRDVIAVTFPKVLLIRSANFLRGRLA